MSDIKVLLNNCVEEFKNSEYFQKSFVERHYKSGGDVCKCAVELAYKDLQFRTIKHHDNNRKRHNIDIASEKLLYSIENNTPIEELIDSICLLFEDDFGDFGGDQLLGKAQKLINMSFKYLYCLNSPLLEIDYSKAHIPLDDRILDFYYSYVAKNEDKISSWSNIGNNDYLRIEENLKNYTSNKFPGLAPIEAEFIIWNWATTKLVFKEYDRVKALYDSFINNKKISIECFDYIERENNN